MGRSSSKIGTLLACSNMLSLTVYAAGLLVFAQPSCNFAFLAASMIFCVVQSYAQLAAFSLAHLFIVA